MIPEEQIKLASKDICDITTDSRGRVSFEFDNYGLAAYTAAVEANMRERCAKECERADGVHDHLYAAAIRSLK